MNFRIFSIILFLLLFWGIALQASAGTSTKNDTHNHGSVSEPMEQNPSSDGQFSHQVIVKDIRAEFQIMSLESMNMKDPGGASHHIMVKFFHNSMNHQVMDAVGKIKVVNPDGTNQVSGLKNYNGVFAANFTFKVKDKYGVICMTKIGGEKSIFKFWYPHER